MVTKFIELKFNFKYYCIRKTILNGDGQSGIVRYCYYAYLLYPVRVEFIL